MEYQDKTVIVDRLLSGGFYINVVYNERKYRFFCGNITAKQRCYLNYIYSSIYEENKDNPDYVLEDEFILLLKKRGSWTDRDEIGIEKLGEQIKIERKNIARFMFKESLKRICKSKIEKYEKDLNKLLVKKANLLSDGTLESHCNLAVRRQRLIFTVSSEEYDIESLVTDKNFVIIVENEIIRRAVGVSEMREISRTNPWRIYWVSSGRGIGNIFGCSLSDLSQEQLDVVYWSSVYDNVFENPERPSDDVVNDDILLDSWLEAQSKNSGSSGNGLVSDGIGKHKEIFLVSDKEGAEKVYDLNEPITRGKINLRQKIIGEKGRTREEELLIKGGGADIFVDKRNPANDPRKAR